MSRGLGKLQRQILEHLEDPLPVYSGNGMSETKVYGADCILEDGVYDLRWVSFRVLRELNNKPDVTYLGATLERCGKRSDAYKAAFSRAVKGLVKRRFLWPVVAVPVTVSYRWRKDERVCGDQVWWNNGSQLRFVKLG